MVIFQRDIPYNVKFRVTNKAGLTILQTSAPVLFDASQPSVGRVVKGKDFLNDQVWFSSASKVSGNYIIFGSIMNYSKIQYLQRSTKITT